LSHHAFSIEPAVPGAARYSQCLDPNPPANIPQNDDCQGRRAVLRENRNESVCAEIGDSCKHALHVAFVHFPIALIVVSLAFDLLSLRKQSLALLRAAYYTVIVAAILALPAYPPQSRQFQSSVIRDNA
jgi:hypothetical protein